MTRPSISKPTWVIQLKSEGARLPLRPKGARLIMNAVVPVSGPGRLATPNSAYMVLPMRIAHTACQNESPNETTRAPYTRNSTFHIAPAHIQKRLEGRICLSDSGISSIPRCSSLPAW